MKQGSRIATGSRGYLRLAVCSVGLCVLAGCDNPTGPRVDTRAIRIEPTQSSVALRQVGAETVFTVPYSITNNSNNTVYLTISGCADYAERLVAGFWQPLVNRIFCPAVLLPPRPILPGESLTGSTIIITDADSGGPGQYRIVLPIGLEVDGKILLLRRDLRASLAFLVTEP